MGVALVAAPSGNVHGHQRVWQPRSPLLRTVQDPRVCWHSRIQIVVAGGSTSPRHLPCRVTQAVHR
jgi:hypothetical protein